MTAVEPLPVRSATQNFGVLRQWWSYGQTLKVREVLAEIWQFEQWTELGYESFRQACQDLLGEEFPRLVVTERREAVAELTGRGMSTRAIASTLGVSDGTVRNDQKASGAQDYAPETRGLDGKTYPRNPITPEMRQAADDLVAADEAVREFMSNDPDIRAANLRRNFSRWLVHIGQHHLFDAEEVASISADYLGELQRIRAKFDAWCDAYAAAASPRPALRAVREGEGL